MDERTNRPVALTLRLYRALARAFPYEFKESYGAELLKATEDAVESIWRRHGRLGLLRLLVDLAIRVPAEQVAQFGRDVRYTLRSLMSSAGFAAVTVVSLTLATCIATCSFSMMNGIVLRVLPSVAEPEQLVGIKEPVSFPGYKRYRDLNDIFSSTMAYAAPVPFGIAQDGRTQRVWGQLVTPSYFVTLGVPAAQGHVFGAQDEQPGASPRVVVSNRFWHGVLGGDPDVVGKTLRVNGHAVTIVGVGPKDFLGASPALFASDLWIPVLAGEEIAPELSDHVLANRDRKMFHLVGRVQPGVTFDSAEARLDAIARQIEHDNGRSADPDRSRRITLVTAGKLLPLRKQDLPFFTSFFLILAALVVLIACTNLANMMLARATQRRREVAIRLALGASRGRLIFQLLVESMMVAIAAGVCGFALSAWLMRLMSQFRSIPLPVPIAYDFTVDGRVFAFTLAITSLTGLLFGLAPAWHATRIAVSPALKEGGIIQFQRFRRLSLRNLLIVGQVAASLMLLVVVGLMSMGIQSTMSMRQGFDPSNLYLLAVDPVRDGIPVAEAQAFFPKLLERVRLLPGVTSACLTETFPVAMNLTGSVRFSVAGGSEGKTRLHGTAVKQVVGNGYFETNGIRLLQGRAFNPQDETNAPVAIIVSETFVRVFWQGPDPVGQRLQIESGDNLGPSTGPGDTDFRRGILASGPRTFEIVGVAADMTNSLIAKNEHPAIYFPLRPADHGQPSLQGTTLIVRTTPGVDALRMVEREIAAMDSRIVPFHARSMQTQISEFVTPLRIASWTYQAIGAFGLVLAAVGLAGVTAYSVSRRSHEIGVRVALGARPANVLALVMQEGTVLVTIGSALGILGAAFVSRALAAMNSSVGTVTSTSTTDPLVLLGAPPLLVALALIACYVPARQSLRIAPLDALRQE